MTFIRRLAWDRGNMEHVQDRHGLIPEEVEEAVAARLYSHNHRGRLMVFGRTEAGRYLTVILERVNSGARRPVTAQDMSASERALLRRSGKR